MLVTKKESAERWCQLTYGGTRMKCIGPECMAWRWAESTPHVCVQCGTEDATWKDDPEQRRGYCGMAGAAKW